MGRRIKVPDNIQKRIDKAIHKSLEECAKKMAEDCKEEYVSVIKDFYADYPSPRSYHRSLESKFANILRDDNYDYKKITTFIDDDKVQIKFKISHEFIEGKPYRADTEWVFDRTYYEGIHGWTPEEVDEYTAGANYAYYRDVYINTGEKRKKVTRFYVNHMLYWYNVPKPMSPPPHERLRKWETNYRNPRNLRQLLSPITKEVFKNSF